MLPTCLVAMVIIQQCQRDGITERDKLRMRRGFIVVSIVAVGASMLTTTKLLAGWGARLTVAGMTAWLVLVNLAAIVDTTAE